MTTLAAADSDHRRAPWMRGEARLNGTGGDELDTADGTRNWGSGG